MGNRLGHTVQQYTDVLALRPTRNQYLVELIGNAGDSRNRSRGW